MKIKTIVLLTLITFIYKTGFSQASHPDSNKVPHAYWVGGGIGGSTEGIELMANANAELGHHWLITGTAQLESYVVGGGLTVISYNLLGGKIYKQKASLFSFSAGLGAVSFDDHPSKVTVGVPVLLQTYWVIGQTFGFGLNATANLNSIQPTAGLSLNIALGRIATHK